MKFNFCRDCRYCAPHPVIPDRGDLSICTHPEAERPINSDYLVTGEGLPLSVSFCSSMRVSKCGTEGKFFEPVQEAAA